MRVSTPPGSPTSCARPDVDPRLTRLERRNEQLEAALRRAGVDVPPEPPGAQGGDPPAPGTEEALGQSEARFRRLSQEFRAILDAIPDILVLQSPDHEVIWANRGAALSIGRELSDLSGKRCHELWHARPQPCPACPVEETLRTGEPRAGHVEGPDGRFWELGAVPIKDDEGKVTGVVKVGKDVTERRQAEAERERLLAEVRRHASELDATFASIPDGVILFTPQGDLVRLNASAQRILALSPAQLALPLHERMALLRLETPDGKPLSADQAVLTRVLAGETVQGVVLVLNTDAAKPTWVSMSAAPLRDEGGALTGAVAVLTDITALHEMEEQREDLLRAVSHDLRTPLVTVGGFAQLLLRQRGAQGAPESELAPVRHILGGARQMNAIIQDLVDSVRLEAGQVRMERKPVVLSELVADALGRCAGALAVDRIQTDLSPILRPVLADPSGLERILVNLLSNALKYSPPDTRVLLTAACHGGEAAVSVSDRGPGIAPEDLPRVFERFYRAKSGRRTEGIGLGLHITKGLVEAQGGRLWAESRPGEGTTFTFTLSLA